MARQHLSDEDLVRELDNELPVSDRQRAQSHLASCDSCRARQHQLQNLATRLAARQRETFDSQVPDAAAPTERLRAQLVAARLESRSHSARSLHPRWAVSVAGIAALALLTVLLAPKPPAPRGLPDSTLTPGATSQAQREAICQAPALDDDQPVPFELANRVFAGYGIDRPKARAYEMDYLITPALGGAADARNLWPQPYAEGIWNSRVKDALEDYLHSAVCGGQLDLATAQRDLASNWIAAYRKYFRTDYPLPEHSFFEKDPPWE